MQRAATKILVPQEELTQEEIENRAFDVFHHVMHYCNTPVERNNYYDDICDGETDLKILEKTRFFMEAKRLVKRDANRTESYQYAYPGNQQDSDGIRYVDEMRAKLANDPEVAILATMRHELGLYITAKKAEFAAQLQKQQAATSITKVNLHRSTSLSKADTDRQSHHKKPKH